MDELDSAEGIAKCFPGDCESGEGQWPSLLEDCRALFHVVSRRLRVVLRRGGYALSLTHGRETSKPSL